MWIRKTSEEINAEVKRGRFGFAIPGGWALLAWVVFILGSLKDADSVRKCLVQTFPALPISFIVIWIVRALFAKRGIPFFPSGGGRYNSISIKYFASNDICPRCFRAALRNLNVIKCPCGGELEPFENWKWSE
jgi:hypothetical protein